MTAVPLLDADADRAVWLATRRAGIGASEIAAVMGISPWDSPFSLWWRKRHGWTSEASEEMSTGTRVEPVVADWWADGHEDHTVITAGLYQHPDRPWQLATPDRLVHDAGVGAPPCAVLECKWTGSWVSWGDPGSDAVPVYYRAQVLWQMDVMGVEEAHIAVLGPGGFRAYTVRRDERDLAAMREAGARWWASLQAGEPPDVDEHTATLATLRRLHPDVEDREQGISAEVATGYRRARALKGRAEDLAARFESKLRAELGAARIAVDPNGRPLATRSLFPTRRLDTARLRAEQPDTAAAYTTETTTDRLTPTRSKP